MNEGDRETLDGGFVLLREVPVDGRKIVTEEEHRAEECDAGLREDERGRSDKEAQEIGQGRKGEILSREEEQWRWFWRRGDPDGR